MISINILHEFSPQEAARKKDGQEKHALFKRLTNTEEVHYDNFQERVFKEGTDTMVLILTPSDDKKFLFIVFIKLTPH